MDRIGNIPAGCVAVELYGVPQLLAGQRAVRVEGHCLASLARSLLEQFPALADTVCNPETGWILGGYTFVVDDQFTRDPAYPVTPTSTVLLVSSAAGG